MKRKEFYFLLKLFLGWRLVLFLFLFLALRFISLQKDFLGGGAGNYLENPWLWAWVNFDGEHYLAITREGYRPLTYFFFPFYPLLSKFVAEFFGRTLTSYALSGLFTSHLSSLLAIIGFWKLLRIDYKESISRKAIFLLLLFPTSFYLVSYYTESTFLALVIWSFYFARRRNYLLAGVLGGISTATRVLGLALIPALAIEAWGGGKKNLLQKILGVLLVPMGLFIYMYFLKARTGDPLEFFNTISIFGEQRSSELILLPQVFYRYFFKILPNLNYSFFPIVFTTVLEILTGAIFFALAIISFVKIRLSYAVYFLIAYLISTFSGSFSSFPRYGLIIFPAFILGAILIKSQAKILQGLVYLALLISLAISCMLFVRGYWIS